MSGDVSLETKENHFVRHRVAHPCSRDPPCGEHRLTTPLEGYAVDVKNNPATDPEWDETVKLVRDERGVRLAREQED